jgi:putative aldouronate transport system permease protein
MKKNDTISRKLFLIINVFFITVVTISCVVPIWNLFCMSLSDSAAVSNGSVGIWPVNFTTSAYKMAMSNTAFWTSLGITGERLLIGVPINMLLIIMSAYPLSKSELIFKARKYYIWVFVVTMLFSGGLIPLYVVVSKAKLVNTVWALVLPGAVPVFNVILLMNFFRSLPNEIEESALIDGASQWTIMWKIFLPLSKPALATIGLFVILQHWNAWFDGLIYVNDPARYPLQSYLKTVITDTRAALAQMGNADELMEQFNVNDKNLRAAQLFISMIPILIVYPWLQKYFTTGIVMGSVKG